MNCFKVMGGGFLSENVVNLSNRVLFNSEIKVLSNGLNFCQTPREINRFALAKDNSEFGRKMRCRAYFSWMSATEHDDFDKQNRFKRKSTWNPNRVDPVLELLLNNLESRITTFEKKENNYSNLDKDERQAIKNLKG